MQRPRVKTSTKQRPKGSEVQQCDVCGNQTYPNDKFCTGCGKPLTGAAATVAPQKQIPKTVTPKVNQRSKTVPVAAPQAQKRVPITVPNMSTQEQKQYVESVPEWFYCSNCENQTQHGHHVKCPHCGVRWVYCEHRDGKIYHPKDCYKYQAWIDSSRNLSPRPRAAQNGALPDGPHTDTSSRSPL